MPADTRLIWQCGLSFVVPKLSFTNNVLLEHLFVRTPISLLPMHKDKQGQQGHQGQPGQQGKQGQQGQRDNTDNQDNRDNKNNTCTSMSSSMPFLSACSANFLMASASLSWAWDKGFAIKCKSTFSLALTDQQILLAWIWARSSCIRRQLSAYWRLQKSPRHRVLIVCCLFCCFYLTSSMMVVKKDMPTKM